MTKSLDPFRFLLMAVSGWMNQQQLSLIDYLREENECCANNWAKSGYASAVAVHSLATCATRKELPVSGE